MSTINRILALGTILAMTCACLTGCAKKEENKALLSPSEPVSISVWTYYNGAQLEAFNRMVDDFNATRGKELGITVTGYSHGSVGDLQKNVMDAVSGKVGAEEAPNIFAAYADTAHAIDQIEELADLTPYLTGDHADRFIEGYLAEGDFNNDGHLKIFPVAKSTELFVLNDTDWQKFAAATGAAYEDFATIEGLVETSRRYYEWTDSLTPEPEDGRAFYGRDAMANYFVIGAMQNGCELFSTKDGVTSINFDRDVMRRLWDNYYIPYINGYFASSGRFRSDDIKTGNIIAFTGSSSGVTFFPRTVTTETEEYDIAMRVFPAPQFEGSEGYAVQQGAGMVVTRKSEKEIAASVEFLMWFTEDERNIQFSVGSGYMPVTRTANDMEVIRKQDPDLDPVMDSILTVAVDTVRNNTLYTNKAFKNGSAARDIIEYALSDIATRDRETVRDAILNGASREEAVAPFVTGEYFNAWYEDTLARLNALEI